jgi:hypothetical protein
MPALPLDEAGKYIAGAYVVFVALLLIYVSIMAIRLQRVNAELDELAELAEERNRARASDAVAGAKAEPASPSASQPAGSGREAEHSGGGVLSG